MHLMLALEEILAKKVTKLHSLVRIPDAERKYSPYDPELYVVVQALRHWQH